MNFERGQEPKDAMNIGVKDEAIVVTALKYSIDGKETILTNPAQIWEFIRRLIAGTIPKDPLFGNGIERVQLISETVYVDWDYNHNHGNTRYDDKRKYKAEKRDRDIPTRSILGKVLDIYGKLMEFPSEEDLKKNALYHIVEYEETQGLREKKLRAQAKAAEEKIEELKKEDREKEAGRFSSMTKKVDPKNIAKMP